MNEDPPRIIIRTSKAAHGKRARSRVSAGEAFSVGFFGGLGYALSRFCVAIAVIAVLFAVIVGICLIGNMVDRQSQKNPVVERMRHERHTPNP
jgi:hypothetical protein